MTIATHAVVYTSAPSAYGRIFRDHEDIMKLSQRIEETEEGLLDIATTVDQINSLPPESRGGRGGGPGGGGGGGPGGGSGGERRGGGPPGMVYLREDIVGNTQHIKINRSGKVEEAHVLPHLGSSFFWNRGEDGPPLDLYNVLILLNPRFPSDLPSPGASWETEEEMELETASALPVAGLMELNYQLEMVVKQKVRYTLLDFVEKKGYRCARIRFEAEFTTDGAIYNSARGSHLEGSGKSSGEIYFAPQEGILVSASMTHNASEKRSQDGLIRYFVTPREMIFLEADDRTTVPIPWRSERIVSFELAEAQ